MSKGNTKNMLPQIRTIEVKPKSPVNTSNNKNNHYLHQKEPANQQENLFKREPVADLNHAQMTRTQQAITEARELLARLEANAAIKLAEKKKQENAQKQSVDEKKTKAQAHLKNSRLELLKTLPVILRPDTTPVQSSNPESLKEPMNYTENFKPKKP